MWKLGEWFDVKEIRLWYILFSYCYFNFLLGFGNLKTIRKVLPIDLLGEPDNNIGRTSLSEVLSMFFLNGYQLLLPTCDKLSLSPPLYKSCENRPVWGARHFQPFGNLLKGFFIFFNYFRKKEGFLKGLVVYIK